MSAQWLPDPVAPARAPFAHASNPGQFPGFAPWSGGNSAPWTGLRPQPGPRRSAARAQPSPSSHWKTRPVPKAPTVPTGNRGAGAPHPPLAKALAPLSHCPTAQGRRAPEGRQLACEPRQMSHPITTSSVSTPRAGGCRPCCAYVKGGRPISHLRRIAPCHTPT